MNLTYFCILEFPPEAAQLVTLASNRLLDGFRPATKRQYARMWLDFQAFRVATGLLQQQVDVFILLSFMEYLFQNSQSHKNMVNYMAALRAYHIFHGLNTNPFKDERLALYLKSLRIQAPLAGALAWMYNSLNELFIHVIPSGFQQYLNLCIYFVSSPSLYYQISFHILYQLSTILGNLPELIT